MISNAQSNYIPLRHSPHGYVPLRSFIRWSVAIFLFATSGMLTENAFADQNTDNTVASDKSTSGKSLAMQSAASQSPAPTDTSKPKSTAPSNRERNAEAISEETEASILEFAKREEPGLFELLRFLKQKRTASYQQALRETGRTQQKLEVLKEKDPELYEIESQLWRTRSKLSLLAAQLSVKDDSQLEKQLASLVRDLESQELARVTLLRDRAAKQLEKLDAQVKERTNDSQGSFDKSLESWKNRIKKQRTSPKKAN